jgi:hypothetical protein
MHYIACMHSIACRLRPKNFESTKARTNAADNKKRGNAPYAEVINLHYIQCFQNALAYFATVVSYAGKMFMKSTPGANVIKLFTAVSYDFS